jgi:porin
VSLSRAIAIAFAVTGAEVSAATENGSAYELDVVYTGETWRNTKGGIRTGNSYLDNLDVQLSIDGEAAWGVPGLTAFAYLLHDNGGTVTDDLVGDAQTISNIEAPDAVRMYELWLDWAFGGGRAKSLRFGLYDLNSEFDASETAALFVNSAHGIGTQIGQTGRNGPSIFPVTSLAARLRWQPAADWNVQLAVLDGVPGDPDHPTSNRIHLGGDDGWLLVAETSWSGGRWRKLALGGWRYTSHFEALDRTDAAGAPLRLKGNGGVYALGEAALWSSPDGSGRALDAYARFGTADGRINRFDRAWALGVVATGLLPARPADRFGLSVATASNGNGYRRASDLQGNRIDSRETAIELTYRAQIADWLVLQPIVQHIVNPDTNPGRDDALAVALRFELSFSRSF